MSHSLETHRAGLSAGGGSRGRGEEEGRGGGGGGGEGGNFNLTSSELQPGGLEAASRSCSRAPNRGAGLAGLDREGRTSWPVLTGG